MANPSAALGVKQFDTPTYGDIMKERDAYRVQQNALAQQQLKQQQNAMLNQAYAEAYDPQTGRVDTNKLYGRLAQGGMGAQIPGQMEAYGKAQEATGKGSSEQFKHAQEILTVSRNELGNARTPQEAMAAGLRIAQQYPEAADGIRQSLAEVQNMSPEQFGAWKMDALRKNLTAAQQLQQHFVQQNLGGSMREIATPEYGTGPATVVPGSEAQVTMTPQQQYAAQNPAGKVVQDASGNYFTVDPRAGTAKPVTMGGGGGIPGQRGGGSSALATNPGALKDSPFAQSQPGYAGAAGGFATFETPEAGVRAQENLLRGAYIGKGHNTISKIVDRYAPQGAENSAASVANYKQYIAQQTGIDINSPISAAQVPAVAKAIREFETGQRPGAPAPAAGGGQLRGPAKGGGKATPAPAAEAKAVQRKTALTNELQMALDLVTDPSNSSAFQSSKKSWWDNQAQSVLHGKFDPKTAEFGVHTALPGGVAHKSVWDRVTKHLIGAMYQTIEPGQAGMNRAVASQKMHIQMMGGGDNPSRETLIEAIKSTAADYGIKLNERGGGGGGGQAPAKPAAGRTTTGDPEMDAIMRKHGRK